MNPQKLGPFPSAGMESKEAPPRKNARVPDIGALMEVLPSVLSGELEDRSA